MARLAYASIGVIALSLLVLAFSPSVSAQGLILEEIGDHEQTCEASSSVEYEWFVYNGYNTSYLLELSTNLSSGDGWSSEFEQQFLLLTPGEGASVKLVVSATSDVTSIDANQTVFFTFTGLEDSADSEVLTGYADTKMIPV